MGKIIQFPTPQDDEEKQTVSDEFWRKKRIEKALQRPEHILIAWSITKWGHENVMRAWFLPEDGKRWVYQWWYDIETITEIASSYSRTPCKEIYEWLKEQGGAGLHREIHICAPLYILLDNKELRSEYLAGNLKIG